MAVPRENIASAFFDYATEHSRMNQDVLTQHLLEAGTYCRLKQSILGMDDIKTVRSALQTIIEGKAFKFKYGRNADRIREAVSLYYDFIKTWCKSKTAIDGIAVSSDEEHDQAVEYTPALLAEQYSTLSLQQDGLGFPLRGDDITAQIKEQPKPMSSSTTEWIISELMQRSLLYKDLRDKGGCLWIKCSRDIDTFISEGKRRGYSFYLNEEGCDAFPDQPVWWTTSKPTPQYQMSFKNLASKQEDIDIRLLRFESWLKEKKQLSDKTANIYRQALRAFTLAVEEKNLASSLLFSSGDVLSRALNSYLEQAQLGRSRASQYRCAVSCYIEFTEGKCTLSFPEKPKTKPTSKKHGEKTLVSPELAEKLIDVISTSFCSGIRPTSIIDSNKLKRLYTAKYDEAFPEDIDLPVVLPSLGIVTGNSVHVISCEQKRRIISCINGIFNQGYGVICYSELLETESELFTEARLDDVILLRSVLKKLMPEYSCKEKHIQKPGGTFEGDILRAFGGDRMLTDVQLKERLPYIDLQNIKCTLSRSDKFIWASVCTFVREDCIVLAKEDIAYIRNTVIPEMYEKGFVSLNHLHLQASCDLNPDVSFFAVRDVVFMRLLADEAVRKGVVATPKEKPASSYDIIKAFCLSQDEITLGELNAYEEEVTGGVHGIAYDCAVWHMIRVDAEKYVADSKLTFDIDAVDKAISLFVQNRMIPIKSISSFTSFPWMEGYSWNLYLVESFLRRFSKRFRIDGGPAATSYVGCVSQKQVEYPSYEDRLAVIVLQDRVELNEKAIGDYLTTNKYILRRSNTVKSVLGKAMKLREQRSADGV